MKFRQFPFEKFPIERFMVEYQQAQNFLQMPVDDKRICIMNWKWTLEELEKRKDKNALRDATDLFLTLFVCYEKMTTDVINQI